MTDCLLIFHVCEKSFLDTDIYMGFTKKRKIQCRQSFYWRGKILSSTSWRNALFNCYSRCNECSDATVAVMNHFSTVIQHIISSQNTNDYEYWKIRIKANNIEHVLIQNWSNLREIRCLIEIFKDYNENTIHIPIETLYQYK